jgi:uncharacterized protein YecT (DUF1311 family)
MKKLYPKTFADVQCYAETHTAKPSFPCSKARTPVEKALCTSQELSIYDAELAKIYKAARKTEISGAATAQVSWLTKRDQCASMKDVESCVLQRCQTRVAELMNQLLENRRQINDNDNPLQLYAGLETEKNIDGRIVYLLQDVQYRFGIITSSYYTAAFDGQKFEGEDLFCYRASDDVEGKFTNGDPDCTKENIKYKFSLL